MFQISVGFLAWWACARARLGLSQPNIGAGWSSPVARQAHNLKVVGSNPTPATNAKQSPCSLAVGRCAF